MIFHITFEVLFSVSDSIKRGVTLKCTTKKYIYYFVELFNFFKLVFAQ